MNTENLLDYLQRKTADTSELQAASSIIQQQSRIERLERENAELVEALHNIRALNPMLEILDERRRLFIISNNFELKYLPIYADQPDPTYIVKWVWEVRDKFGASVAEAHEWLYQAIDTALAKVRTK